MPIRWTYRLLSPMLLGALAGCVKNPTLPSEPPPPKPQGDRIVLAASTGAAPRHGNSEPFRPQVPGPGSRTMLNGLQTLWLSTDRVGLFTQFSGDIVGPDPYMPVAGASPGTQVIFEGASEWFEWNQPHTLYAYYPYDPTHEGSPIDLQAFPVEMPFGQVQRDNTPEHIGPLDFMFAPAVTVTSPPNQGTNAPIGMCFEHLFGLLEFHITISPDFQENIYILSAQITSSDAIPLSIRAGTVDLTLQPADAGFGKVTVVEPGSESNRILLDIDVSEPVQTRYLIPSDGTNYFPLWAMALPGDHSPLPGTTTHSLSITIETENEAGESTPFTIPLQVGQINRGVLDTIHVLIEPAAADWKGDTIEPQRGQAIVFNANTGKTETLNNAFLIYTPGELNWLSVHADPNFKEYNAAEGTAIQSGNTVIFNDIHLSNIPWSPIGSQQAAPFTGRIFGQGHTISGLNVEGDWLTAGLFGYGSDKCYFDNLNVVGSVSSTASGARAGGIIGRAIGQNQMLYNVSFNGHIETSRADGVAGGLVGGVGADDGGTGGRIDFYDCDFTGGEVIGNIAGGIIGRYNSGVMTGESVNYGNITGTTIAGGIVGEHLANANISNATNYGRITQDGNISTGMAGGIVGKVSVALNFDDCINRGDVTGYSAGGILGRVGENAPWGTTYKIEACYNYATIQANMSGGYAGGFAGTSAHNNITKSGNYGNVSGFLAGGLTGYAEAPDQQVNIKNCFNRGMITGPSAGLANSGAGGLGGRGNIVLTDCYNQGRIDAFYSGGLVADIYTYYQNTLARSYNAGMIDVYPSGRNNQIYVRGLDPGNNSEIDPAARPWAPSMVNINDSYGISGSVDLQGLTPFSASGWPAWPSTAWNSGGWNNGTPIYPTLANEP